MEGCIFLHVDSSLEGFVEAALTRLRYLHADLDWAFDRAAQKVVAKGDVKDRNATLQKDLNYQIYREKIFSETGDIRRRLYEAL